MSFDIEKRFRFVSTDDINDEVNDNDYKADDIKDQPLEEEEEHKKPRLMPQEENIDNLEGKELEDEEEEEEEEE